MEEAEEVADSKVEEEEPQSRVEAVAVVEQNQGYQGGGRVMEW